MAGHSVFVIQGMNYSCHLLCFKLILASPVEKDMTAPKANNEEKGVDFEGGAIGSKYNALRRAIKAKAKR